MGKAGMKISQMVLADTIVVVSLLLILAAAAILGWQGFGISGAILYPAAIIVAVAILNRTLRSVLR